MLAGGAGTTNHRLIRKSSSLNVPQSTSLRVSKMPILSRRTALHAFGIASITSLLPSRAVTHRKVVVTKPGENRFAYTVPELRSGAACKLTNEDSAGACSLFELVAPPRTGPPRQIHHREDEWYYVLAGEYLFEVDGSKYTLPVGGSIWAPRDIPHVWANTSTTEGRVILMCQPGGFENFFDAFVKGMMEQVRPAQLRVLP
jgi:quercetin dioxygenase-like cupin family protein